MPAAYWGESFGSGLLSDPPNISARQTEIFESNQTTDLKGYKRDFLRARRFLLRQVCHTYILSCTYPLLLDHLINMLDLRQMAEGKGLFTFISSYSLHWEHFERTLPIRQHLSNQQRGATTLFG